MSIRTVPVFIEIPSRKRNRPDGLGSASRLSTGSGVPVTSDTSVGGETGW